MKNKITKELIAQYLPEDPVIIEAGAHKGKGVMEINNAWPKSTIHAFEPVPEIYQQLILNIQHIANAFTYNLALSNTSSKQKIYMCPGKFTPLSSLYLPGDYFTKNPKFSFKEIEVSTITLDEWARQNKIFQIDMLKLDAQGSELNILMGAIQNLKNVNVLLLEANLIQRYENIALYDQIKEWLLNHNFIEIVSDEIKNNRLDILFVKK